jgi:transcriptional regulator with XRE-family HTH domain
MGCSKLFHLSCAAIMYLNPLKVRILIPVTIDPMTNKIHEGRNVKRFREMLGIKQEALAYDLGDDWNQKKISLLEQKETIEPVLLQQISAALKIPVEAFQNFDEEQAINIISNTFHDFKDNAVASAMNYQCTFNPMDKIVQLYDEKIALYERMLKEKDEMMVRLERLIKDN